MLPSCHSIPHPCSLAPECGKVVHMQQYRVHMAAETRAEPLLAFGSLSSKHCTYQARGQGVSGGSPHTFCLLQSPCKEVPLAPSASQQPYGLT